jgi:glycosyltransferase involved in cell wall biosynthesis
MTCIIFGDAFTFPEGDASTNRVYNYARGFLEHGSDVHVVCFRNSYLPVTSGEADGIRFYHPFNRSKRSNSFILRRMHSMCKYAGTFRLLRQIKGTTQSAFILCYTKSLSTQLFAFMLSRILGFLMVLERSEHPFKDYTSRIALRVKGIIRVTIEIRFTDLIFCISDYLIEFYKAGGAGNEKLYKVPSTVDIERFIGSFARPLSMRYICYCGSLTILKDGVDILIESFARLTARFKDVDLALVGRADTMEDEEFFRDLVASLGLKERVHFTGKLSRNDIPAYLCHAEILTLARPKSIVADAGFPSKVTEYLATGRPVVVTSVGEIPVYLKDNFNAFVAEPGSVESFAERMAFVLENSDFAESVGLKGRDLAKGVFNYHNQAANILSFLKEKYSSIS